MMNMGKFAIGYKMNFDEDLVYDFLVGVGNAISGAKQDVVKRKVSMKIKRNKYLVIKIKVKLEYGSVLKFKHVEPISFFGKLVNVTGNEGGVPAGAKDELMAQLEALGLGGTVPEAENTTKKKPIGFVTE